MKKGLLTWVLSLCLGVVMAQTSNYEYTTSQHSKEVIGYFTQWDAWKGTSAGVTKGFYNQLNLDYSQYTILNWSFLGVAYDGSLHSGDLRNSNINDDGEVQEPGEMFDTDVYSSWDLWLLYGDLELLYYLPEGLEDDPDNDLYWAYETYGYTGTSDGGWENVNTGETGDFTNPLALHNPDNDGKGVLELAHENGVKLMASIGGWSMCKHFPEVAADADKRAAFVADCKTLVEDYGFDGIDIDWEYPGPFSGMNFTGTDVDYANFVTLMTEIREAIGDDKLITAAFSSDPEKLAGFDWSALGEIMDYFNMMTYDMNGGWNSYAGHNSPLYGYENLEGVDWSWDDTYKYLISQGVDPQQINMGVAFYGRGIQCSETGALNAATEKETRNIDPDGTVSTCADYDNWSAYDGAPNYTYIIDNDDDWTYHWDDTAKVPYLTKGNYFLSYDNEESIQEKAKYVNTKDIGGVIVWQVFGDLDPGTITETYSSKLPYAPSTKAPLVNTLNQVFAAGTTLDDSNSSPVITFVSPADGDTISQEALSEIDIELQITDIDGLITGTSFVLNSDTVDFESADSLYTYSFTPSSFGEQTLKVVAADNDSASVSKSLSFTVAEIEQAVPVISFVSPSENDTIKQEELEDIDISVIITDADGEISDASFVLNDEGAVFASSDSMYTFTYTPDDFGNQTLKVTAVDDDENSTTETLTFTVEEKVAEQIAPEITFVSPTVEEKVIVDSLTDIDIELTITDEDGEISATTFVLNDDTVAFVSNDSSYTYTFIPETYGTQTLKATAVDDEGNSTTSTLTFNVKEKGTNTDLPITEYLSEELWEELFPYRAGRSYDDDGEPIDNGDDYYDYENFVEALGEISNIKITFERRCATNAYRITWENKETGETVVIREDDNFTSSSNTIVTTVEDYGNFVSEGTTDTFLRELAAFLANISQETTGGWDTAPKGRYYWGLYFKEEQGYAGTDNIGYRVTSDLYPPVDGKSYHGRGPIQLSYNYNYGQASEFLFGDKNVLLNNPDTVVENGVVGFETAIWFWMTEQYPKPSCHDVMAGNWEPTEEQEEDGLIPGFGMTINIINGGIECNTGGEEFAKVKYRVGHFERYADFFNVSMALDGSSDTVQLGCANMVQFSIDSDECDNIVGIGFSEPADGDGILLSLGDTVDIVLNVNDPDSELSDIQIAVDGKTYSGTSAAWVPSAFGDYTITATADYDGEEISAAITVTIYDESSTGICVTLDDWDEETTYATKGTQVVYDDKVYENKWWTQGDTPGEEDVWEYIQDCGTSTTNEAPVIASVSPANGDTVKQEELSSVTLSASVADADDNLSSVVFTVDGDEVSTTASNGIYSATFTPSAFDTYTFAITATDEEGETATSSVSFTVLEVEETNETPVISSVSPADGDTIEQEELSSVTLSASVADADDNLSSVVFTVDGDEISSVASNGTYTATFTPSAFGSYTFAIAATDEDGETATSSVTFTVSEVEETNEVPVISSVSPADGEDIEQAEFSAITLSASVADDDDNLASVAFTVDGDELSTAESNGIYTATFTPSAYDSYTFVITATDEEGETATSTTSFTVSDTASSSTCGYDEWEAQAYSTAETYVYYNGGIYYNQWYAESYEIPGEDDVWEFVSTCGDGSNLSSTCGYREWDEETTYSSAGSDTVYYDGKIYTNKWWTLGDEPDGTSGAWEYLEDCSSSKSAKISTEADDIDCESYVEIYPNPVNDILNVKTDVEISKLKVYNMNGRVLSEEINAKQINVGTLAPGVYFIKIENINGTVKTMKFVKK